MAAATHVDGPSQAPTPPTQEETTQAKLVLRGHEEWVSSVAFIPRTNLLVTSSADKTFRVWDLDTGKQVGEPLLSHECAVWKIAVSPDGRWVVSGGWNGSILVWEVATNKTDLKREPVSFKGHEILLRGLAFAPDSETFASASNDMTVCIWKRATRQMVLGPLRLDELPNSVSYSFSGRKLAAGTDKHIIVWDATNGEELFKIQKRAYRIAFTPDSLRLVSSDWNNIRISDATTGDIIKQFDAHTETCQSLAISPNGSKLATTSADKTMRFFDMATLEPIGEPFEHPDVPSCVAFSEDSQFIATGCEDKLVRTWTVPLSETELQQKILKKTIIGQKPYPRRAPIQTSRFFDGFDPHSPPGRNSRAATTSRRAEGSGIKNIINRLFSRSSALQGHSPPPPLVDVSATRGKYRTANVHSGKRDKKLQQQCPPRQKPHATASSSSAPPAGASNVIGGAVPATLRAGSTSATGCFAAFTRCFPCLSRTRQASPSASSSG